MRSASPISCLASQRIWRVCSGSLSCAEVIASAAVAAAAFVSEAPGDLPPSHGGGQSAGTDSTDSKETAEPPEGRRTWLGLGSGLGLGLGVGVGVGLGLEALLDHAQLVRSLRQRVEQLRPGLGLGLGLGLVLGLGLGFGSGLGWGWG